MCIRVTSDSQSITPWRQPQRDFLPLSNLLEGGRSSCKWWFKVPPAPNCHPTVYETHPWLWNPGTLLQLPVAVTACSGPNCNWCQLDNGSPQHFWINQSVMPTADYVFYHFIRWQLWPLISSMLANQKRFFFFCMVISEPSVMWLEQEGSHLGSKSQMTTNAPNE